jgi:hypothetical protein
MAHADLFADLARTVAEAAPDELPAILGKLAEAEAVVRMRIVMPTSTAAAVEDDRLLTLPQVAAMLGVPEDYCYTLSRQRKIPTVRLPGLDKGGRAREGKYVRVRLSALRTWARGCEDKGIDGGLSVALTSRHDRKRSQAVEEAARADAGAVRAARRRSPDHREQVGDGAHGDPAHVGEADEAAGRLPHPEEGVTQWRS